MQFSVALCTYNGERFIEEQLQSILHQTMGVSEIVICDDNSKDSTVAIAESILKSSGISYQIVINNPPLGVAGNFLKAMKLTNGDYVFTCDQDDIWHENKVKVFHDAVQQSHKALYFSDGVLVDGDAKPLGNTLWEAYRLVNKVCTTPTIHALLRQPMVTGAAMLVSRQLIEKVTSIPDGWLHDEWFAIMAALNDSVCPICEKTFDYRQHGKNVVGAKSLSYKDRLDMWLKGLKELEAFRQRHYTKCIQISVEAGSAPYAAYVEEASAFWRTLCALPEMSRLHGIFMITRLLYCGEYQRFYSGYRGYIRDILAVILQKRKKAKHNGSV